MASVRSTFWRTLALVAALAAAGPASGAPWSGECDPPSTEPQLSGLASVVDQAIDRTPQRLARTLATKHLKLEGKFQDVPWLAQEGSTCGFYAAAMVIGRYNNTSVDRAALGAQAMLADAKQKGRTRDGYVSIDNLAETIEGAGYRTRTTSGASVDMLVKSLDAGVPPIVLFVVNTDDPSSTSFGGPRGSEPEGQNLGHYAVIEGVFTDPKGKRWIVAQHGWRSEPYLWSEEEFTKSWAVRGSRMLEIKRPKTENQQARRNR